MIVHNATPEEQGRIDELFAIAFEQGLTRSEDAREPDPRVHNWAAFDEDGQMMSTFSVTDFDIHFDGHACKMGGIGGVATLPEYRRRGGIRGCFNKALPDMFENGYDFSYLYPFSTAYYRKFGYECCIQKLNTVVDLGLLKVPSLEGSFRLAEKNRPMTESIRALDRLWEEKFNLMVIHGEEFYNWTKTIDPAARQEFTYVYFDVHDKPKAYTTFRMIMQEDGRNLVCSRFCFADREGFLGLMSLFKSLSADHRYVKFQMPSNQAMQYLCPEWSMGAAQWNVERGGMVRVVNVRRVLEKARYRGTGALVLEVRDDQIPGNNHRFAVEFTDGRAVSIEITDREADAVLTIPTFSALIAGVWDFDDAKDWMDCVEVNNENACFDKVFYRKNLMIADYF